MQINCDRGHFCLVRFKHHQLGAWLGAGIVAKRSERYVQIGMGFALIVAVGLKATRRVIGSPFDMPPWIPPLRFVRVLTLPSSMK